MGSVCETIKETIKDLKDNSEVFKSISKGKVNSKVKLTIKRNDEEKESVCSFVFCPDGDIRLWSRTG